MTYDSKDFSMHLSHELIKSFGEPYQSSITALRCFAKKNLRVSIDYERERNLVHFIGEVLTGGVILSQNDAVGFIQEINKVRCASTFRMFPIGKNLSVYPMIEFNLVLTEDPDDKTILGVIDFLNDTFLDLSKIEKILI